MVIPAQSYIQLYVRSYSLNLLHTCMYVRMYVCVYVLILCIHLCIYTYVSMHIYKIFTCMLCKNIIGVKMMPSYFMKVPADSSPALAKYISTDIDHVNSLVYQLETIITIIAT